MGERESTARAREVGSYLRQTREAAGLSLADMAERLGWSQSKVSRLERGAAEAMPVEVVRFAAHCGTGIGEVDSLLDWFREAAPPGYWLSDRLSSLIFHETAAQFSQSYDPLVVPGLLQTEDYATALIGPKFTPMRMERQRLVHRRGFQFYIHEQALRLPVGGNRVMNEQMLKLALMCDQPMITIRVVPTALGERGSLGGSFVLFRYTTSGPLLYLENQFVGFFVEDHDHVSRYQEQLTVLTDVALNRGESRELLAALASEFDLPEDSRNVPDDLAKEQLQRGT
ncbi:MAG TPA: helix-turn-helix transcriptional regulator [Actinophytocola sp.]|uniref:helix-turn-helix domain-containing protein n=1 Tax=Actinophytocola sp. TaxID=1872138 RepID=UPI002E048464|nr:helix-turn-helix transcriptional regulator [Actinophytocola sp.]